jgi:hypothetical protein
MAQHSMAQHSTAWRSTAQHGAAQHSMAQHSTAWRSTAQHGAALRELLASRGPYQAQRVVTAATRMPTAAAYCLHACHWCHVVVCCAVVYVLLQRLLLLGAEESCTNQSGQGSGRQTHMQLMCLLHCSRFGIGGADHSEAGPSAACGIHSHEPACHRLHKPQQAHPCSNVARL